MCAAATRAARTCRESDRLPDDRVLASPAMSARADAMPRSDPLGGLHPIRRTIRYYLARLVVAFLTRAWLRFEVEGHDRLPSGPAIYAFNHLSWIDPFVLMATLPLRPRLSFFGPKEEDMRSSGRNRVMLWTGSAIPYKPGKNDLLEATRRVSAVIGKGGVLAIAAEGRIGAMEDHLLPLNDGAAYFALRSHVPLVRSRSTARRGSGSVPAFASGSVSRSWSRGVLIARQWRP